MFRQYLETRTDAPSAFHLHAGLCTLAVALGSRCWVDGPAREVYPNLNSVVLAPSGMGKSVPLDMASNIIRKAGLEDCILPSSFSQEALLDSLSRESVGFFLIQEFAAFQALLGRDYNRGAEQTLTELFDVPESYERKTIGVASRSFTLKKPCVTILGASSPDWFAQAFKGSALRGGWLARFLFCPSRDAGRPIGDPGPRDLATEAILADHLRYARQLAGRFDTSAVRVLYNEFAQKCRLAARDSLDFGGMRSRGPVMAQKVAMLFHVSRDPSTLQLTTGDMRQAIEFVERTHKLAEHYLTEEVAHDKKDADRIRLVDIVKAQGGRATWSVVLKNSHMDARDFEQAVKTLCEADRMRVDRDGRSRVLSLPEFAISHANGSEFANRPNGRLAVLSSGYPANSANSREFWEAK